MSSESAPYRIAIGRAFFSTFHTTFRATKRTAKWAANVSTLHGPNSSTIFDANGTTVNNAHDPTVLPALSDSFRSTITSAQLATH